MNTGRAMDVLLTVFVVEAIALSVWVWQHRQSGQLDYETRTRRIKIAQAEQEDAALAEFEKAEYLASGRTVHDRIYNTPRQSLRDLLGRLGEEAFPDEWTCSVKVEEFTKLLLKVQTPGDVDQGVIETAIRACLPIAEHGGEYLTAVAVFDRKHICRLFIDESALNKMRQGESLSLRDIARAASLSRDLARFNGRRIKYDTVGGHIVVPVAVYGTDAVVECRMMLDTGASVSVFPVSVIRATGNEDLRLAPKRTFETANGRMTCPMVERLLVIQGVESRLQVGVSMDESIALLGVDFFEGRQYVIDSRESALYIWEE